MILARLGNLGKGIKQIRLIGQICQSNLNYWKPQIAAIVSCFSCFLIVSIVTNR